MYVCIKTIHQKSIKLVLLPQFPSRKSITVEVSELVELLFRSLNNNLIYNYYFVCVCLLFTYLFVFFDYVRLILKRHAPRLTPRPQGDFCALERLKPLITSYVNYLTFAYLYGPVQFFDYDLSSS